MKSNIGHLDAAAGVASLIKAALMLEHRAIPPSLHCDEPGPHIDFASTPFYVNTRLVPWESDGPRRAGVSSFGVGGTNAHAVLEEAPVRPEPEPRTDGQLLLLSARTERALKQRAAALADHLTHASPRLEDVARTLADGRSHFPERWSVVSRSAADAARALAEFAAAPPAPADEADARDVVFVFPGQGAQFVGMGADPLLGCDLKALMFGRLAGGTAAAAVLNETRFAQPALFTIELALARLWMHWGVTPRAMIGHSIGEYVAACVAGVLSQDDALRLVALRGQLMQQMPAGAMLAVARSAAQLEPFLGGDVDLAAVNAAAACVLSGTPDAIAAVESRLAQQGVLTTRLAVSHAFHSGAMDGALDELAAAVARLSRHQPQIPYISNRTGTWISQAEIDDPASWSRHLRETVRFADGLATLVDDRPQVLLEVGPGSTLTGLCRRAAAASRSSHVALASLGGDDPGQEADALKRALGRVWEARVDCDWGRVDAHISRRHVPLPTYPFERRRHWIDPDRDAAPSSAVERTADESAWYYAPSWRNADAIEGTARVGTVLVFADRDGLADAVVAPLQTTGRAADVVIVRAGAAFARTGVHEYTIDPRRPEHYETLVQACRANHDAAVTHVVHAWSVASGAAALGERLTSARVGAFGSLVSIARAWASRMRSAPLSIVAVTSGVHDVTGEEALHPEQALAIGPCRVIPQEMPNVRCRHVDVMWDRAAAAARTIVAEQLVRDILAGGDDTVVAYRGRRRWIQSVDRRALDRSRGSLYRDGGVYLVTGGLGGVGAIVAEHLARTVSAKLVLMSRTVLPPRETWPEAAGTHADADLRARLERVLRIERAGGTVLPVAGDAGNPADLAAALAEAKRRFGGLHGIFHAAAVPGGGLVRMKTAAQADAVLRPKVDGVAAIDEVCRGEPLDFVVLFSSVSALLGEFGQVDYCAANAFLDAYARSTAGSGRRVIAINWDTWRDDGMSRAALRNESLPAAARARIESELRDGLSAAEGCRALDAILGSAFEGQIVVSTRPVEGRIADLKSAIAELVGETDGRAAHAAAPGGASHAGSPTADAVARIMATALGLPAVEPTDNFFDLGGHSLLATRLLVQLGDAFGVEISLRAFLESPTAADLAVHVDTLLEQSAAPAAAMQPEAATGS